MSSETPEDHNDEKPLDFAEDPAPSDAEKNTAEDESGEQDDTGDQPPADGGTESQADGGDAAAEPPADGDGGDEPPEPVPDDDEQFLVALAAPDKSAADVQTVLTHMASRVNHVAEDEHEEARLEAGARAGVNVIAAAAARLLGNEEAARTVRQETRPHQDKVREEGARNRQRIRGLRAVIDAMPENGVFSIDEAQALLSIYQGDSERFPILSQLTPVEVRSTCEAASTELDKDLDTIMEETGLAARVRQIAEPAEGTTDRLAEGALYQLRILLSDVRTLMATGMTRRAAQGYVGDVLSETDVAILGDQEQAWEILRPWRDQQPPCAAIIVIGGQLDAVYCHDKRGWDIVNRRLHNGDPDSVTSARFFSKDAVGTLIKKLRPGWTFRDVRLVNGTIVDMQMTEHGLNSEFLQQVFGEAVKNPTHQHELTEQFHSNPFQHLGGELANLVFAPATEGGDTEELPPDDGTAEDGTGAGDDADQPGDTAGNEPGEQAEQ